MIFKDLPEFLQNVLNRLIKQSKSCYSIKVKPGAEAGDGSSSENLREKQLEILCKVMPFDEIHLKDSLLPTLYSREVRFYDEIISFFVKYQEEKNVPKNYQFLAYPKCYATIADDKAKHFAILMEDLGNQGCKLPAKREPASIESMRLAMRELGKLHGLSVALKDQKPKEFQKLKDITDLASVLTKTESMKASFRDFYDRTIKSLRNEMHKDIMCDIKDIFQMYLEFCVQNERTNKFGVLSHGKMKTCASKSVIQDVNIDRKGGSPP